MIGDGLEGYLMCDRWSGGLDKCDIYAACVHVFVWVLRLVAVNLF